MSAALQDALARMDDHVSMLDDLRDNLWRISSGNLRLTGAVGMLDFCRRGLDDVLSAIRAAHNLPASAASSAAPPADDPACSAGLTAGASSDAPAISRGADRAVDFTPGDPLT